jgi:prepilin-type N-terminal cleavage/methylation domain-containing protein
MARMRNAILAPEPHLPVHRGFTIVEMLATLAVIAIVSAVRPRKAMKNRAYVGVELASVTVSVVASPESGAARCLSHVA